MSRKRSSQKASRPRIPEASDDGTADRYDETRRRRFNIGGICEKAAEAHLDRSIEFYRLSEAMATKDTDFVWGLTQQIIEAASTFNFGEAIGFVLAVIRDVKPRDHIEDLLAAQMGMTHLVMMSFVDEMSRRTNDGDLARQDSAVRAYASLGRSFTSQMAALQKHRSGGEQKVTVRHVSVNDGGQAIVGNVTQAAPMIDGATSTSTPALADARQPAMDPIVHRDRVRVRRAERDDE